MAEEKPTHLWKELTTTWDGGEGFTSENIYGAKMLIGKDREGNIGLGPMDALLAGLAGCTMYDILDILRKKRQVPVEFQVRVRGKQRLTEYPYIYTEFELEYVLWGENIKEKDLAQAVKLSEEKYCSAGGTLSKAGPIHSTFRILKPGEPLE
jgi:putative redox protein